MDAVKTAGDVFMEDIIANKSNDDLRLIYADWLEVHGGNELLAKFIRAQIGLLKLNGECYTGHMLCRNCVGHKLDERVFIAENQILKLRKSANTSLEYEDVFIPLDALRIHKRNMLNQNRRDYHVRPSVGFEIFFERGFPSHVYCEDDDWTRWRVPLLRKCPTIEYVELRRRVPTIRRAYNDKMSWLWLRCPNNGGDRTCYTQHHIPVNMINERYQPNLPNIEHASAEAAKIWLSDKLIEYALEEVQRDDERQRQQRTRRS